FDLVKELTGTLALQPAIANTYSGFTFVVAGALSIQSSTALQGSQGTFVLDGAQLQLNSPVGGPAVVITGESLSLTGDGIAGSGALLNTGGNNTWAGPVTLDYNPGFAPITYPVANRTNPAGASIGVSNTADVLTISGAIGETIA